MADVTLPPDIEELAVALVASGRFRDRTEVVVAGIDLLRRREAAVAALHRSLVDAEAESDRASFLTADEVHAEMALLIDELRSPGA